MPYMEAGRCLGPEGNGVSLGEGGEGGPGPPGGGKDKQSVLSEGRDKNGQGRGGPGKSDVMKKDRREQSKQVFSEQDRRNSVIMIAKLNLISCFCFQENKPYGVKKPFALILCLHTAVHHVTNSDTFCWSLYSRMTRYLGKILNKTVYSWVFVQREPLFQYYIWSVVNPHRC